MSCSNSPWNELVSHDDILSASDTLRGQVHGAPCARSRTLSNVVCRDLWLKFENQQFTASFKERGALNRLSQRVEDDALTGVVAMSAGNHAQRVSVAAIIGMLAGMPTVKIVNTERSGATVSVEGKTLEDSPAFAHQYGEENKLIFIHSHDDPMVIAGQGTLGLEVLSQAPDLDELVVLVSGGGLAAGLAIAAKRIKLDIQLIGVQAELFPSMYGVFHGHSLATKSDPLAEGTAIKQPGLLTRQIICDVLNDIVLVSEAGLERAVSFFTDIKKTVVEAAGAAGIAAILSEPQRFAGRKFGSILCGGNIDTRRLARVLTHNPARRVRLSRLLIDLVNQPGHLSRVTNRLGDAGDIIVEVAHQRASSDLPAKAALPDVVVETRDVHHLKATVAALTEAGLTVTLETSFEEK